MDITKTDETFPTVVADTSGLPYRVRSRGLELAYTIFWICFGLFMGGFAVFQLANNDQSTSPLVNVVCLVAGAGALYALSRLFTPYLVLYPDRLEKRGLTGWRTLMRSDVEGVRSGGSDRAGALFEIVPRDARAAALVLRKAVRNDPVVIRWLKGAPDLDAKALAAEKTAILADARYGATPAERQARLDNAKRIAFGFNVVCVAVAVGMYFVPGQYLAHLALAAGGVAIGAVIVHQSNGLFVWLTTTKARPSVIGALAPAASAAFQSMDIDTIGGSILWVAGVGAVAALAIWASRRSGAFEWRAAPGIVLFSGLAIYGLANLANVAFAPPGARTFPLLVMDKYVSGSKNRTYHLTVAAWDDQPAGPVSVPSDYYDKVRVGSLVCIVRHKGGLGIDWFEVNDCAPGNKPPAAVLAQFAAQEHQVQPSPNSESTPPVALTSSSNYPDRAQRAGKEGRAIVRCEVYGGGLAECRVLSEDPPGYGFGQAALDRVGSYSPKPQELQGRATVDIPVNFKLTP